MKIRNSIATKAGKAAIQATKGQLRSQTDRAAHVARMTKGAR